MHRALAPVLLLVVGATTAACTPRPSAPSLQAPAISAASAELARLYAEDQADRQPPIDWRRVWPRDSVRLARVEALRLAGQVQTARDHYHAAMLLQHGKDSTHYRLARDLAREAARRDTTLAEARWLSAAAQDRYLQSMGQPQWYGTQVNKPAGATRWTLEPIDTTAVTDAERRALGVESLAEARARVAAMNQAADSGAAVRQP